MCPNTFNFNTSQFVTQTSADSIFADDGTQTSNTFTTAARVLIIFKEKHGSEEEVPHRLQAVRYLLQYNVARLSQCGSSVYARRVGAGGAVDRVDMDYGSA